MLYKSLQTISESQISVKIIDFSFFLEYVKSIFVICDRFIIKRRATSVSTTIISIIRKFQKEKITLVQSL